MNIREQVEYIVREFEGGLVNHKDDRGSLTNHGITIAVFLEERPGKTAADLMALSREDAIELLTEKYALKPGFARITDPVVRLAVIDYAIHSHPFNATKALQYAARVKVDGIFGPQTEYTVNAADSDRLVRRISAYRLRLWARIFRAKPSQRAFAAGWLNRIAVLLEAV